MRLESWKTDSGSHWVQWRKGQGLSGTQFQFFAHFFLRGGRRQSLFFFKFLFQNCRFFPKFIIFQVHVKFFNFIFSITRLLINQFCFSVFCEM